MSNSRMRALVTAAGGILQPHDTRTSWLSRIANRTGLSLRVMQAVWWEIQMSAETERRLRAAARSEANELAERFEQITRSMSVADAEFFAPDIAALSGAARSLRNLGDAGTG